MLDDEINDIIEKLGVDLTTLILKCKNLMNTILLKRKDN